jgi:hypothetical protein
LGSKIVDELDKHEDLRAVAEVEAQKEHSQHSHAEVIE